MREIKFRVYDKRLKSMHIVGTDSHDSLTCFDGIVEYYNLQNGEGSGESGDYILMQYTGLKDKNGKEIYEGDIVVLYNTQEGNVSGRVYWDELLGQYLVFRDEDKLYDLYEFLSEEMNIIGNIYENPELLKGDAS